MGWGRSCGRWKVSRHHTAGRLLTADLMQQHCSSQGQAVCLEQAPARFLHTTAKGRLAPRDPPVTQLPGSPDLQQGAPGGSRGLAPSRNPKVEPPQVEAFSCKPEMFEQGSTEQGLPRLGSAGDLGSTPPPSGSPGPKAASSRVPWRLLLLFPAHAEEATDLRPLAKCSARCPSRTRAKAEQDNPDQCADNLCIWDFFSNCDES